MRSKLPSEMNHELRSKWLFMNHVNPMDKDAVGKLAKAVEKGVFSGPETGPLGRALERIGELVPAFMPKEVSRFTVLMLDDTHIGTVGFGLPTRLLLGGLVKWYEKECEPCATLVLFFGRRQPGRKSQVHKKRDQSQIDAQKRQGIWHLSRQEGA